VLALRADFTGDEAAVNAAQPLVAVAAILSELELICPSPITAAEVRREVSVRRARRRWCVVQLWS
jgi:hypothetical protein